MRDADGCVVYMGYFKTNKRHGRGLRIHPKTNGRTMIHDCEFVRDKADGSGTVYEAETGNPVYTNVWKRGVREKSNDNLVVYGLDNFYSVPKDSTIQRNKSEFLESLKPPQNKQSTRRKRD